MANEHEGEDRQPRWNTAGYWTDRREGENWPGDRSRSRDYDREDMRRYNRRALAQSDELRRMRGQGRGARDNRQDFRPGRNDDLRQGSDRERARSERARFERENFNRDRGGDRYDRERPRRSPSDRVRPEDRRPNRGPRFQGAGREYNDYGQREDERQWSRPPFRERNSGRPEFRPGRDWDYAPDRYSATDADLIDNYWGRREQEREERYYGRRGPHNSVGDRPDLTSGRHYRNDLPTYPPFDWIEDRDYDLDPGYDYEFGTDYDILDEIYPEERDRRPRRRYR